MSRARPGERRKTRLRRAFGGLALLLAALPAASYGQTSLDLTVRSLPYRLVLPTGVDPATAVPLVVMLHGCDQDVEDFAEVTRMNELAAQQGFVVAYPEQTEHPLDCWRWYEPAHQTRGQGEPAAIVGMVEAVKMRDDVTIDDDRVYAAGLSAGAGMATILGAAYPDVFAAIGVVAGVPYGAADGCFSGFNAMQRLRARMSASVFDAVAWSDYWSAYWFCWPAGEIYPFLSPVPAPDALGERAFDAMGQARRVVPVIVFQGLADTSVVPDNGWDMVSQWAQTNDLALDGIDDDDVDDTPEFETAGSVQGGYNFVERTYEDDQGNEIIKSYMIVGLRHAWPGGAAGKDYSDPKGPDASARLWTFFAAHPKP